MKGSEEQWMLVKDSGVGKAVLRDYEKKREMVDETEDNVARGSVIDALLITNEHDGDVISTMNFRYIEGLPVKLFRALESVAAHVQRSLEVRIFLLGCIM